MSKSGNRNNGEDAFREWLSDHLRFLVVLIALLLAVVVIIMVVSLLDNRPGGSGNGAGDNPDAVVIMSETARVETGAAQSEAVKEPDAGSGTGQEKKPGSQAVSETSDQAETGAAKEPETEERKEAETGAAKEPETEERKEAETETVKETETEEKAESEPKNRKESEKEDVRTGRKTKDVTETETVEETETETGTETETETETETGMKSGADRKTGKETDKKTGKGSAANTESSGKSGKDTAKEDSGTTEKSSTKVSGKTTTSSTEKTVNAPSSSPRKTESAALAGFGSETEKESGTQSGTITVTSSAPVKRITALVSGGSSTGNNRASVTNIDTGTTIGTYHNSGSALNTAPGASSGTVVQDQEGDTDTSGGLVSAGDNQQVWDGSGSSDDVEIVGQEYVEPAPNPTYRTVISACNIRSYPDYGDNVIGGLGGGETVLFYGEEAGWYKIEYNGVVGYIGPRFLQ